MIISRSYICLILALFAVNITNAQWVKSSGPAGGYVTSIASSGGISYAGTYGGVFKTTNNGASWFTVNAGLVNPWVSSVAINGSNVFIGHGYSGVSL